MFLNTTILCTRPVCHACRGSMLHIVKPCPFYVATLQGLLLELERTMCQGLFHAAIALQQLGCIQVPSTPFNTGKPVVLDALCFLCPHAGDRAAPLAMSHTLPSCCGGIDLGSAAPIFHAWARHSRQSRLPTRSRFSLRIRSAFWQASPEVYCPSYLAL